MSDIVFLNAADAAANGQNAPLVSNNGILADGIVNAGQQNLTVGKQVTKTFLPTGEMLAFSPTMYAFALNQLTDVLNAMLVEMRLHTFYLSEGFASPTDADALRDSITNDIIS